MRKSFLALMEMTARESASNSRWYPDQSTLSKAPAIVVLVLQDKLFLLRKSSSVLDRL